MMIHKGICLPDGDGHFVDHINKNPMYKGAGTYQFNKYQRCFPLFKNFRHALDVGAHIGLWSRVLSYSFDWVSAFEPNIEYWKLWEMNLNKTSGNATLKPYGLAETERQVTLARPRDNSGMTHVAEDGTITASLYPLDKLDMHSVDFLKIDCEGYEKFVLEGGKETILRDKPVVLVEQKPGHGSRYGITDKAACELLESWGASLAFECFGDYCYHWR